jgi:putative phosphotransacetylase
MSLEDAAKFGVKDGDYVTIEANGERRTTFYDVQIRANAAFRLEMHIDTDDANAAGIGNGFKVKLVK